MNRLDLVNGVLRRLREDRVGTVNLTSYSTMVGDFVNDAKKYIEGCWDWSANRSIQTITTAASDPLYSLTDMGQDPKILNAWNATTQTRLRQMDANAYLNRDYTTDIPEGRPEYWAWRVPDANDDQQISLYPTPDGVYTIQLWVSSFQDDLTNDATELNIPPLPVILRAVAMLAEEKGETGGFTSARYFEMADKALADAIAYDASKYPDEVNWYTV